AGVSFCVGGQRFTAASPRRLGSLFAGEDGDLAVFEDHPLFGEGSGGLVDGVVLVVVVVEVVLIVVELVVVIIVNLVVVFVLAVLGLKFVVFVFVVVELGPVIEVLDLLAGRGGWRRGCLFIDCAGRRRLGRVAL